ncbi:unnamed protein product, partial [Rotaria magnacalcarata]
IEEEIFIKFREYLRAHPDARDRYSQFKKSLFTESHYVSIKEYTLKKNAFINDFAQKAEEWYRQQQNYVHIGYFDDTKMEWSCCNATKNEKTSLNECHSSTYGDIGCYQPGFRKDNYHSGRFSFTEYNLVAGWWTCCSQGMHSNGCVKMRLLGNGAAIDELKGSSVNNKTTNLLPLNTEIKKSIFRNFKLIFNVARYRMCLGQVEINQSSQSQSAFQPKLNEENNSVEREHVLQRLDTF